jgi:CheY-like chemotaxis protein
MKKIVMIEDNEDHAVLIRRAASGPDCAITHYSEGEEALKALGAISRQEEMPALVFLDIKLPGTDGFGVLEGLRKMKHFAHTPVVMLTTSSRKEEIKKAYHLGASGFVVKSDDFNELVTKLKHAKNYWLYTVELPELE